MGGAAAARCFFCFFYAYLKYCRKYGTHRVAAEFLFVDICNHRVLVAISLLRFRGGTLSHAVELVAVVVVAGTFLKK